MQNSTSSHKSFVQSFFVSDELTLIGNGTAAFSNAGTSVYNTGNTPVTINGNVFQPGEVCLTPKQVDILNQDYATTATAITALDGIYIAQGRDDSFDTPTMTDRPMEISEFIPADSKIKIHARGCELGTNNTWIIGDELGQAAEINQTDNVEFNLIISYRGSLVRRLHGRNFSVSRPSVVVDGTWAQLGLATAAERLSYIVENLVYQTNRESVLFPSINKTNNPIFAMAICQNAGTGTLLSGISVGDTLTIGTTPDNLPITVKVDNAIYASIQAAIARPELAANDKVVAVDLNSPSNEAEKIVIMALDRSMVDTDREPAMKYRLDIALGDGFNPNVAIEELVRSVENVGGPRQTALQYESYAELNKQFRVQRPNMNAFQYPSDINPLHAYMLIDIEWSLEDESTISHGTSQPLFYTIAIPCCDQDLLDAWDTKLNAIFPATAFNVKKRGPHIDAAGAFDLSAIADNACSANYSGAWETIS